MDTLLTHQKQSDKTILVCDPDFISSTLVASMIKNKLGTKCLTAPDGRAGARAVKEFNIDLIITEVYLPYLSGCAMIELIRNEINATVPILLLSSDVSIKMKENLNQTLVNAFAEKPINLDQLMTKISFLLQVNEEKLWLS
ncbi:MULTISPECIES: response regulator [unclassified Ekhidna]|uniref:response regulator n=1 Tax=unclassified Ekhidna TaxID=2632188 RepID=UPI0032DE429C